MLIGYSDMNQGSVGAQLGGQTYTELLVFQNDAALDRFTKGEFSLGAGAKAVALKAGVGADAQFKDGIAVYVKPRGGLMFDASIEGQKFNFVPTSSSTTRPSASSGYDATGMPAPSTQP